MAKKRQTKSLKAKKGERTNDRFVEYPNLMSNVKRAPNLSKAKASR